MTPTRFAVGFLSLPLLAGGVARADIDEYSVAKFRYFDQTGAAPEPAEFSLFAFINSDAGDATAASLNRLPMLEVFPGEWCFEAPFPTQAALDLAHPASAVHTLGVSGGALGDREESETLDHAVTHPPPAALLAPSLSGLLRANPGENFMVEWAPPDASVDLVNFSLASSMTGDFVIDADIPPGQLTYEIDGSLLVAGASYRIELLFISTVSITTGDPSGFGEGAVFLSGFVSETHVEFEPSTGCDADLDRSGTLNLDDIDAFVVAFLGGDLLADLDGTGTLNLDDIDHFVTSFLGGCP